MEKDEDIYKSLTDYLIDERKIVTYKWLSENCSIHVNHAKQLLSSYHQRQDKNGNSLTATYLLSGLIKHNNSHLKRQVQIVRESDLEEAKGMFQDLLDIHVYSLQPTKLQTSDPLYLANSEISSHQSVIQHQHSALHCDYVRRRCRDTLENELANNLKVSPVKTIGGSKKGPNVAKPGEVKVKSSSSHVGVPSDSKSLSTDEGNGTGEKELHGNDKEKHMKSTTSNGKGPVNKAKGVMTFFANAKPKANKATDKKTDVAVKTEESKINIEQSEDGEDDMQQREDGSKPKKSTSKKIVTSNTTKKRKPRSKKGKTSEEPSEETKGRKRIMMASFSSSSEDEADEDTEAESGRPDKKVLVSDSEGEEEEESGPQTESPRTTSSSQNSGSQQSSTKRRRRKLVQKTTVDEDGFMVTEKVWESGTDSEGEVVAEVKLVKEDDERAKSESLENGKASKKRKADDSGEEEEEIENRGKEKKRPGKGKGKKTKSNSPPAGKQATLMSFFKRKES